MGQCQPKILLLLRIQNTGFKTLEVSAAKILSGGSHEGEVAGVRDQDQFFLECLDTFEVVNGLDPGYKSFQATYAECR